MFSSNPTTGSPTSSLLDGARRRLSEGATSSGKQPAGLPSPEPRRGTSSLVTPLRLPQVSHIPPVDVAVSSWPCRNTVE